MNSSSQNPNLGDAAGTYLANLSPEDRIISQQEIYKFVRWYSRERSLAELAAPEIANYAERLSLSDTDYLRKLKLVRAFLVHAKKKGWCKNNLAAHLKAKKKPQVRSLNRKVLSHSTSLTRDGYAKLEAELAALKAKRSDAINEMRHAAADKDFRENAPLQAAKEQRQQLEGRIIELEESLKSATIMDYGKQKFTAKASIGDSIVLIDLDSGEELCYKLVDPREVDPARGKVSSISPLGKAIIGHRQGETIEIEVPIGRLRYKIKEIQH